MAQYIWTGSTSATWSTASNWLTGGSPAVSAPGSGDDCLFGTAFTGGLNNNVTLTGATTVRSVYFDDTYTATFTHNTSLTLTLGDGTAGYNDFALRFSSGMTYTRGGSTSSAIALGQTVTSPVQKVESNGKTLAQLSVGTVAGGSWVTTGNLSMASSFILTNGEFDMSSYTLQSSIISSNNANSRTFKGSGRAEITQSSTSTVFNVTSSITWQFTGTVALTGVGSGNRGLAAANVTFEVFEYIVSGSTGNLQLSSNTFNTLKVWDASNDRTILLTGTSCTIKNLDVSGRGSNLVTFASNTPGTQRTIVPGNNVVSATGLSFTDTIIAHPYKWFASSGTDGGNNVNVNFTSQPSAPYLRQSENPTGVTATSVSATFDSPTVAGNLLVAAYRTPSNPGTVTPPSGWTQIWDLGTSPKSTTWYKIADGTETTVTVSQTNSISAGLYIAEFAGFVGTPALDTSGTNSGGSATSLLVPSSPITPANATTIALAVVGGSGGMGNFTYTTPPTNSYQEDYTITPATSSVFRIGIKPLTSASAQDTTLTWTTGRANAGGMAIFYAIAPVNHTLNPSDSVTITDSLAKAMGKVNSDSVSPSDSVAKAVGLIKSDSATATDAVAKGMGKSNSDSVTITDSFNRVVAYLKSVVDSVTITDSFSYSTLDPNRWFRRNATSFFRRIASSLWASSTTKWDSTNTKWDGTESGGGWYSKNNSEWYD